MTEVKLPPIGEGIAEGEIIKWLVQPGDTVAAEQTLVEVLTDKASVEIPSPVAGVVEALMAKEGDLVPVGHTIVKLGTGAAPVAEAPATVAANGHEPATALPVDAPRPTVLEAISQTILATPSIRQFAREQGIDLNQVPGSGPYGRITREDVAQAQPQSVDAPVPAVVSTSPSPGLGVTPAVAAIASEERIPLRGIRRKIAQQMVKAKFTAPDFFYADEADMTDLVAYRSEVAPLMKAQGVKLTYLAFLVKAVVSALKAYPEMNASLDDEAQEIVIKRDYHIGIATAAEHGLVVPVIKHADRLGLRAIAQEIERLSTAVREGKATPQELSGGTFTITNIGAIGGLVCAPIINHPEVGILGFNKIYQKPVVYQGEIVPRWVTTLSLSCDHRVVDGAEGARFVSHILQLLQNPKLLLLE